MGWTAASARPAEFAYLDHAPGAQLWCKPRSKPLGGNACPVIAGVRLDLDIGCGSRKPRPVQKLGADGIPCYFSKAYFPLGDAQVESYFRAIADGRRYSRG